MSVVESKFYKNQDDNTKYIMKSFGIDNKFTIEITRYNLYSNHDYSERMSLNLYQVKQLRDQLNEFLSQQF